MVGSERLPRIRGLYYLTHHPLRIHAAGLSPWKDLPPPLSPWNPIPSLL